MSRILVIEDEAVIRAALKRLLERAGYEVGTAASVGQARDEDALTDADIVIADLRLPGSPGTDVIPMVPGTPVLIMTSYASVRSAVDSMRLGAVDCIAKPFSHDELLITVDRIADERRLRRQNRALKSDLERRYPVDGLRGRCPAMRKARARIEKAAPRDTAVLVTGEPGTGKELVARILHERSARRHAPIVMVNCAAIPSALWENEPVGQKNRADTDATGSRESVIAAADGGTLFLDELGALPPDAQARLLTVLREGEVRRTGSTRSKKVDVRIIAATQRDLQAMVDQGAFSEDLYLQLRASEIELPPLRERGEDLLDLADALLVRSAERLHRSPMRFSEAARHAMRAYRWPGNVRELENAIECAVIRAGGEPNEAIEAGLLGLDPGLGLNTGLDTPRSGRIDQRSVPPRTDLSLDEYIRAVVHAHQGAMTETELARRLGISRKALWERRRKLGIPRRKGAGG
jgi:DNA-binding NtrC family response regulator